MSRREPPAVPPDDPLAPDPRLRAALRHAPDADLAPPPALSAAISAAAHAALRAAAPPVKLAPHQRLWRALQVFWHDLSAPRPVWAGGAAAVVVAGLTLSLWVNEQTPPAVVSEAPVPAPRELAPESARPGAATPPRTAAMPAPAPAPSPAPAPAPAAAVPAPPAADPAPAKPEPAGPQPAATAKRGRSADALADHDAKQTTGPETKSKAEKAEKAEKADKADKAARADQAERQLLAERGSRPPPAAPREQDAAGEVAAPRALTRGSGRPAPGAAATDAGEARAAAAGATPTPPAGMSPAPPPPPAVAAAAPPPPMSPPRPATANSARAEGMASDRADALAKSSPSPFPAAPPMQAAQPAPVAPAPPPVMADQRRAAESLRGPAERNDSSAAATPLARAGQAPSPGTGNRSAMKLAAPVDRPPSLSALLGPNAGSLTENERHALQVLDGLTRQRWQRQPAASERDAALRQQSAPAGLRGLRVEADGAHWTEPDGSQWFAPLDPAAVTRLRGLF